jgi:hypothetical protein
MGNYKLSIIRKGYVSNVYLASNLILFESEGGTRLTIAGLRILAQNNNAPSAGITQSTLEQRIRKKLNKAEFTKKTKPPENIVSAIKKEYDILDKNDRFLGGIVSFDKISVRLEQKGFTIREKY